MSVIPEAEIIITIILPIARKVLMFFSSSIEVQAKNSLSVNRIQGTTSAACLATKENLQILWESQKMDSLFMVLCSIILLG